MSPNTFFYLVKTKIKNYGRIMVESDDVSGF